MCQVYLLDDAVHEYSEGYGVEISNSQGEEGHGRLVVRAYNEGKYNFTQVDLVELLTWVKKNLPAIWEEIK